MKERIDWKCYATFITKSIRKGILITSCDGNTVNTMTIGWGTLGFMWSRPVFVAYVRKTRYTAPLILASNDFTINVPFNDKHQDVINYLGTTSGRDENKIEKMHLTLERSDNVESPGIKEFPLTLECNVLYIDEIDTSKLPRAIKDKYYPDVDDETKMLNSASHYVIYGEIVDSYIIK